MTEHERYHVNENKNKLLQQIQNFALDMDGTIYLEDTWIEGAVEFLHKVEATGRRYCFMTNNSSKNAQVYLDKLAKMGLTIRPEQLVTSGHATTAYLHQHFPDKKVFLLGNEMLRAEFIERGITVVDEDPDLVVSAFDTTLTYKKIQDFCDYVRAGLPYIATHPDFNCPTKTGFMPDIGAIHALIEASTGRTPDKIVGKPNKDIIDYTLAQMGGKPENTAVVGDRLYTDVKSGVQNGLYGIFVLSGEAQLCDLPTSDVIPDLIFDSVKDMIPLL
ncbi:MAG: HAD-IIA family hydrolase [Faecalibacterium sp.]